MNRVNRKQKEETDEIDDRDYGKTEKENSGGTTAPKDSANAPPTALDGPKSCQRCTRSISTEAKVAVL